MVLKNKKIFVHALDSLFLAVFFIPVAIDRLLRGQKNTSEPKNILILELWGIGDVVMMSSILRPLRTAYPRAKVTLLAKDFARTMYAKSGLIDEFVTFDFPWTRFKKKYAVWTWDWRGLLNTILYLRKQKFDVSLDARGDVRNNVLSFFIRCDRRIGYSWTGGGYFLTDTLPPGYRGKHRVEAWMRSLHALGIKINTSLPCLSIPEEEKKWAIRFLRTNKLEKKPLVAIHPGAQIKSRCWPLDKFARVAELLKEKFNASIIVFVEPEGYGSDIPIQGDFTKVKVSLEQLGALLQQANLLLCNDSGAMHMATAVGTKTISIFGPGDHTTIGPFGKEHTIMIDTSITCRPCFDHCSRSKTFCLDAITIHDVTAKAGELLRNR